ncbi:MAG: hypothetical protein M3R00_04125 [Pseudomonadota bacterium]|nr:hypothetical protein [Pseudomonadota bacterium]
MSKEKRAYLLKMAEFGDVIAQCDLANLCAIDGQFENAIYWYRPGVQHGYISAINNLAAVFCSTQRYSEAAQLYQQAIDLGEIAPLNYLGELYLHGLGVEKDYAEAARLFNLAATQGDTRGFINRGILSEYGLGVHFNQLESKRLYELGKNSISLGISKFRSIPALYYQGKIYENRGELSIAFSLYKLAAQAGCALAQFEIGYCYESGKGVSTDNELAVNWYLKSAEKGLSQAQNSIAWMYREGKGTEQNYAKMLYWYVKSAAQNYFSAENSLGHVYSNGIGVEPDLTEALKWYRLAAAHGHPNAQKLLPVIEEKASQEQATKKMREELQLAEEKKAILAEAARLSEEKANQLAVLAETIRLAEEQANKLELEVKMIKKQEWKAAKQKWRQSFQCNIKTDNNKHVYRELQERNNMVYQVDEYCVLSLNSE